MRREKVLIVDDEPDLLDLIDFNLTRNGFLTSSALDGHEAVAKLESFEPDIMVLDLMLPGLDGWEVCRQLKQKTRDIPVIMLTAKGMPEDKVKGFEFGADEYITKPFNVKELIIRVENLLDKKRGKEVNEFLIHEMANNLYVIGSYSEMLSEEGASADKEKQATYLNQIIRHAAYASELISGMGTLMKIESGEFSMAQDRCDVVEIAESVAKSYKAVAAQKNVGINIAVDRSAPQVNANRAALRQVFANLIGNAVKYSGEHATVEVCVLQALDGVLAVVKDNGWGIPAAQLPHIFKKGYRADNVATNTCGSGLGLYISKTLLDKMGAAITVESVEGEGSTFAVFFGAKPFNEASDGDPCA